jgi:membrane peptidoglycan carboxypeptidase
MNSSYGDSTNSARGRARISGSAAGYDGNDDDPYAVVSSGPTGRASVSGRARSGSGTTGRASVRPSGSSDGYSDDYESGTGRAPGIVGRAVVAPPGQAPGSDTPGMPRQRRPVLDPAERKRRQKRARRRNILLSAFALIIMLTGIGVVGGTYYFGNVPLPKDVKLPESTTIYFADGKHQMARFGDQNRTIVDLKNVSPWVPKAVVAAEDNTFYTNSGVSIRGVFRAIWNNLRGGRTQGGSTIAQQYARQALDSTQPDRTVSLKVKEAVVAVKLEQKYSKNDIMQMYLNIVYFGRGAYGIQAAAQAYFGTDASKLTAEQAMVLAGVIRAPSGGYDPANHPENAKPRFDNYVKPNMVKLGYLTQQQADGMQFPTTCGAKPVPNCVLKQNAALSSQFGKDVPTGLVVHHALDELTHLKNADGTPKFTADDLKTGGYKIITTVDYGMEKAALAAASKSNKDNLIAQQKKSNLQAALVSVEPKSGRVKAYYGGDAGDGTDYAGCYNDPVLDASNCGGRHPPGSTAKAAVLATALTQGISIDSYWNGVSPREFPKEGRTGRHAVTNSGGEQCATKLPDGTEPCQLWKALADSVNTVFYAVSEKVTPQKVLNMWHALGVNTMWTPTGKGTEQAIDFTGISNPGDRFVPRKFSNELAIGQFPITVVDNATVYASLAGGVAVQSHFVQQVQKAGTVVYNDAHKQVPLSQVGLSKEMLQDETWALSQVHNGTAAGINLENGRDSAVKTGTWQQNDTPAGRNQNGDAWFCGYTPNQLATCSYVGNVKDRQALKMKSGKPIFGATLPGPIWKQFMNDVLSGKPEMSIPGKAGTGDPSAGEIAQPPPQLPGDQGNGNGNGGGGGPGGGGGGPGGGGGNGCNFFICPPASPAPTNSAAPGGLRASTQPRG